MDPAAVAGETALPVTTSASTSASRTEASVFEGLFVRGLKVPPTSPFAEELKRVGVDIKRLEPSYPTQVWHASLSVALRHAAGTMNENDGYRFLAQRFVAGFFDTVVGKLLAVGIPLMGPDRVLQKLGRHWSMAQPTLRVAVEKVGDKHWSARLDEPDMLAEFCAGIIYWGLIRAKVVPTVLVKESARNHCVLDIRWQ